MKKVWFLSILIVYLIKLSESISCDVEPINAEARLRKKLLCSYDNEIRPNINSKNATLITVKLVVKNFEYDDDSHELTVHSWLAMVWTDDRLKWNKNEFDDMASIKIHSESLWSPDFTIYNSKYTQFSESCEHSNCIVYNTGAVSCIPPCSHTGVCKPKYNDWPFDSQNCTLTFGAWVHKGEEIDFRAKRSTIDNVVSNHKEWRLTQVSMRKNIGNYSCCPKETYPTIQYSFVIQRHSASIKAFIITPAIIFAFVNLMTLLLDPNCTERMLLSVLSILTHLMVIQQLSWYMPRNGDTVPNILIYIRDSFIISAILLLNTIIMRALWLCKTETPTWIKTTTTSLKNNKFSQMIFSKDYIVERTFINHDNNPERDEANLVESQVIETVTKSEDSLSWQTAVKVLDRVLFLGLVLFYIIMLIGLVPSSYSIKEGPVTFKEW